MLQYLQHAGVILFIDQDEQEVIGGKVDIDQMQNQSMFTKLEFLICFFT